MLIMDKTLVYLFFCFASALNKKILLFKTFMHNKNSCTFTRPAFSQLKQEREGLSVSLKIAIQFNVVVS